MTRRHADPIDVLRRDQEPVQFLWRGRLHLVRSVLGHWLEGVPWWSGREALALQTGAPPGGLSGPSSRVAVGGGDPGLETMPLPASPRWGQRAWGEPAPDLGCAIPQGGLGLPEDREVWRVEAGAGQTGPTGVFDLTLLGGDDRWVLTRVHD